MGVGLEAGLDVSVTRYCPWGRVLYASSQVWRSKSVRFLHVTVDS